VIVKFPQTFRDLAISQASYDLCIVFDPQYNSASVFHFSFSSPRNCLRATSEYRTDAYKRAPTYLLKAPGAGVNRAWEGGGGLWPCLVRRSFRVIVIRYVRGTDAFLHRRACLCRARRPMYRQKTGNWIKFAARGDRAKARPSISSGMIYLTRFVLIRAYYMRDREPRRVAPYRSLCRLTKHGHVSLIVARLDAFITFDTVIKFQKRRRVKTAHE